MPNNSDSSSVSESVLRCRVADSCKIDQAQSTNRKTKKASVDTK